MFRALCLALLICVSLTLPVQAAAPPPLPKAHAAVLMDTATGKIVYDKQGGKRLPPASTTKILTAILAIESGRMTDAVTVSEHAAKTRGSTMHLKAGQVLTLEELVTGLMLRSGNDAAVAIAEYLGGSVEEFAVHMNARAHQLGAKDSHFVNPHGLPDPDHYVTARDLAKLARFAMQNERFAAIVGQKEARVDWEDAGGMHEAELKNTNKLLWRLAGADGVKTGSTGEAGPCLVASATEDDHRFVCVLLNDPARWQDAAALLRWGLDEYTLLRGGKRGDAAGAAPLTGSLPEEVSGMLGDDLLTLVKKETAEAAVALTVWDDTLTAPVVRGQKIGTKFYYAGGVLLSSVDVLAAEDVPAAAWSERFIAGFSRMLSALFRREVL